MITPIPRERLKKAWPMAANTPSKPRAEKSGSNRKRSPKANLSVLMAKPTMTSNNTNNNGINQRTATSRPRRTPRATTRAVMAIKIVCHINCRQGSPANEPNIAPASSAVTASKPPPPI